MRYTVYKTTNTVNGKSYVGVHKTEDPNDSYLGSGSLLKAAVKKYGREAFVKEVLFDFDTPEEMEAKEAEIVDEDFVDDLRTYNLVPGGYQGASFYQALREVDPDQRKEWAKKANAAHLGLLAADPEYGEAFRERISEGMKKAYEEGHPVKTPTFEGREHSEETKAKMSASAKARKRNSQQGTRWVWHPEKGAVKVHAEELEARLTAGWIRARRAPEQHVQKPPRGLSATQKRQLRELYATGQYRQRDLAERFGVHQATVSYLVKGVTLPEGRQRIRKPDPPLPSPRGGCSNATRSGVPFGEA